MGYVLFAVFVAIVAGPRALKNVLGGTHDYCDGFSREYKKDAEKYKEEQYKK